MLSSCRPSHSLLRSPQSPPPPLLPALRWDLVVQGPGRAALLGAPGSGQWAGEQGPATGCWEPRSGAASSSFAEPAGSWVVGIFPSDLCFFLVDHAVLRLCQPFSLFVCHGTGGQEEVGPGMEGAVRLTGLWHISGYRGGQPDTVLWPATGEVPETAQDLCTSRESAWVPRPLTFGTGSSLSAEGVEVGQAPEKMGLALPPLEWSCQWLFQAGQTPGKVASLRSSGGRMV